MFRVWVKMLVTVKKGKTLIMMIRICMNTMYVHTYVFFQEAMLSSQPSVGRLILAVLRDITGWLIAVATSLQSQSSPTTMWPCRGRWAGVGHTHMHTQPHTHTQQYTQVGLKDANMYCAYSLCTCGSAHALHLLSSASWFKGFNPAERFQCHLLNVEMWVYHRAVLHADVSVLFSGCHSKYILSFI